MEREKHYKGLSCIYKITSPSGKVYIGQTQNLYHRINKYKYSKAKGQHKLHNSFNKYGMENHIIEVLHQCELEHIDEMEFKLIKEYDAVNSGLNLREGGGSFRRKGKQFFSEDDKYCAYEHTLNAYNNITKKRIELMQNKK